MSTTVTYKGSTLTTAENQTRTLKTAGKYMEDDITIVDITENNNTGGFGSVYQDQNGYIVLSDEGSGGGSGDGYILTTIIPQQTVTPNSSRQATPQNWTTALVEGDHYLVTLDDTEYVCTCAQLWGTDLVIGDGNVFFGTSDTDYPFAFDWVSSSNHVVVCLNTSQHTIKVEHLELVNPTVLTTKTITTNGTYNASSDSADGYSSVTVNVSGGGSSGNMSDPIRFFDYDGTLVASYSSVPASLPSVPTHTGLTSGTWNYTLQQMTTQFNAMGTCDVGANYDTVSGATEIDIVLQECRLHPYLSLAVNGTVSIDWGDGSTPDTSTGTSLTSRKSDIHHEYASAGSYTIKITKTSGTGYSLYCSSTYPLLNKGSSTSSANRVYSSCVQAVRVGEDCTIGGGAFYYCYSLASVSIPNGVTNIGSSAFSYCYPLVSVTIPSTVTSIGNNALSTCFSLASVSIPSTVTSIGTSAFYNSYSLARVSIPNGVTSIGNSAFYNCYSLVSVTIPSTVTNIADSAFGTCPGVAEYHFLANTPPTLASTNVFSNIQSDCIIYVPSSKLNDYKTAENWSTYASYMVGE